MSNTGYVKVDKEIVLRACNNFEEYFQEYKKEKESAYTKYMEGYNSIQRTKWFPRLITLEQAKRHFYTDMFWRDVDDTNYFDKNKFKYKPTHYYTAYTESLELAKLGNVLYLCPSQAKFVNKWKEI